MAELAVLPAFSGTEWEDFASEWANIKQEEGWLWLRAGGVIHQLRLMFGSSAVAKFAWQMGESSVKTLQEYARVYRRLLFLEDEAARAAIVDAVACGALYYSHLRLATHKLKEDDAFVAALEAAQDNNWTIKTFSYEIQYRLDAEGKIPTAPDNVVALHVPTISSLPEENSMPPSVLGAVSDSIEHFEVESSYASYVPPDDEELKRLAQDVADACFLISRSQSDVEDLEDTYKLALELKEAIDGAVKELEGRLAASSEAASEADAS